MTNTDSNCPANDRRRCWWRKVLLQWWKKNIPISTLWAIALQDPLKQRIVSWGHHSLQQRLLRCATSVPSMLLWLSEPICVFWAPCTAHLWPGTTLLQFHTLCPTTEMFFFFSWFERPCSFKQANSNSSQQASCSPKHLSNVKWWFIWWRLLNNSNIPGCVFHLNIHWKLELEHVHSDKSFSLRDSFQLSHSDNCCH